MEKFINRLLNVMQHHLEHIGGGTIEKYSIKDSELRIEFKAALNDGISLERSCFTLPINETEIESKRPN